MVLSPAAWAQRASAWRLAWSDEFDGATGAPPDPAKWKAQSGPGAQVGGNQEAETYCAQVSPEPCKADQPNAYMDGSGHLVLVAVRTAGTVAVDGGKVNAPVYTSARLVTIPTFRYGRLEASIRIPAAGKGVWPAFWALGQEVGGTHWPAVGEIDVMEQWNPQPGQPDKIDATTIHGAVHGPVAPGASEGFIDQSGDYTFPAAPSNGFHQYAVDWEPGEVDFYVDGARYFQASPAALTGKEVWAQDGGPFSLLLNLAMGGGFFGYPDATTSTTPTMVVDYVRVYQRAESSLQAGWSNADIGGPAVAGASTFRNGVHDVEGSGSGISGRFDQFQFAYKPMAGEGEVSAHLLGQSSTAAQAKAGLMLREGRGAAAPYAMLFVSPDGKVHLRFRAVAGDVPGEVLSRVSGNWLKLLRRNDIVTALVSSDGKKWEAIGDARMALRRDLLAGLVSTSRDNKTLNQACFDYVDVTRSDSAFDGEPATLPGVIQAERFDGGGTGYTYSAEFGDAGPKISAFSPEGAQSKGDTGYFIHGLEAGRYINYAVNVLRDGDYSVTLHAAAAKSGSTAHFNLDQKPLTQPFAIPDTAGSWNAMRAPTVHLSAGPHILALVMDTAGSSANVGIDSFSLRTP